jgi:RNA ligase (TIGR02306 family)
MSIFAVSIERIEKVWPHTNADRLSLAKLASMTYQFVIGKEQYQAGDLVVYFPIDSLIPQPIIEQLGLTGKLSGAEKNRVKTARLRGEISQGIVGSPALLLPDWSPERYHEGQDVAALLGVTKYDPPPVISMEGNLVPLPAMVSVYDIEGAERFASIVEQYLMDAPVLITEKLEGSHFSISIDEGGEIAVSQRRYRIEPVEGVEHDWHKVARLSGLREKMPALREAVQDALGKVPHVVNVRGEMIGPGIQGNYYKLPTQTVRIFEIEADGQPLDAPLFLQLAEQFGIETAPVLSVGATLREWLAGQTVAAASNGTSVIAPHLAREGIVIRPLREQTDLNLGRVVIKQRSPEYLAGSDY